MGAEEATLDPVQTIADWIRAELKAEVVAVERTSRWRPAWFVRARTAEREVPLFVRGLRVGNDPGFLLREFRINQVMHAHGIRVPRPYGYIDSLPAIVMDAVSGQADLRTANSDAEREAVRDQLVDQLVAMHAIPADAFLGAGIEPPENARAVSAPRFDESWRAYEARRPKPNPSMTFISQWLLRNEKAPGDDLRFIAWDAGQFMFDGAELTAMLDLEFGLMGDPMADLAALRIRGTRESAGDLASLFELYGERRGRPVDTVAIRYLTIVFGVVDALMCDIFLSAYEAAPTPEGDYFEHLTWIDWGLKLGYEALAEYRNWPTGPMPSPAPQPGAASRALSMLRFDLGLMSQCDACRTQIGKANKTISWLQRLSAYGAGFEQAYLDDAMSVLGTRPVNVDEANEKLDTYVRQAGPAEDERLCRIFLADVRRRAFLLATPESKYLDGLVKPLAPI